MYPGQTTILRFNLVINEYKSFKLVLNLTSNINDLNDYIEIQKLTISNIGANFPCVSILTNVDYINDYNYELSYGAGLILDLNYYPIDILNISASTVIIYSIIL